MILLFGFFGVEARATEPSPPGAGVHPEIARAMQLTAQGKQDQALAVYRRLAEEYPGVGLPALGRFLRLTGRQAEAEALLDTVKAGGTKGDTLVRARTLLSLGEQNAALALLESDAAIRRGQSPHGTLLLAQLLRQSEREPESEHLLRTALPDAPTTVSRDLLFRAWVGVGHAALADHPTSLLLTLRLGLENQRTRRPEAVRFLDPIIIEMQSRPGYLVHRAEYLESGAKLGGGAAWFAARLLVREERHAEALVLLEPVERRERGTSTWPLLAEETAELYRILERPTEALSLLQTLARSESGREGLRLKLQTARSAMAVKDWERAMNLLETIPAEELSFDERRIAWILHLTAAARAGRIARILDVYEQAAVQSNDEDIERYHRAIFTHLIETEQHQEIEDRIRKRFESDSTTPAVLWRLVAQAAVEMRKKPNEIEALYQYVLARPGDVEALAVLARVVTPVASELAQASTETLAVPNSEVVKLGELAEKSLRELIRAQPYITDNYCALISVFQARGDSESAARVPEFIARDSRNPRLLGTAALALAISGFPAEAMKYYDRALELDPDAMEIRMNRTSCLTRLDRFDEALGIYREILETGFNGRMYHVHEVVGRIWAIGDHLKRVEELIVYFRGLKDRLDGEWRDEALVTFANLLAHAGRNAEARTFFDILREEGSTPQTQRTAWESVAVTYVHEKQFEKAIAVFAEAEKHFAAIPDWAMDFLFNRAEVLAQAGKINEAIALMRDTAHHHPGSQAALAGLYQAAALAEQGDNPALARELYAEFLKSDSTDFSRRRQAEEKLEALK
jgi:tetratricopeptide (TPR) repeat protein